MEGGGTQRAREEKEAGTGNQAGDCRNLGEGVEEAWPAGRVGDGRLLCVPAVLALGAPFFRIFFHFPYIPSSCVFSSLLEEGCHRPSEIQGMSSQRVTAPPRRSGRTVPYDSKDKSDGLQSKPTAAAPSPPRGPAHGGSRWAAQSCLPSIPCGNSTPVSHV